MSTPSSTDSVNTGVAQLSLHHVNIAIASDSVQQRSRLRKVVASTGMQVVLMEPLTRLFLRKLEKANAAVILLDLHDHSEHDEEVLSELLDNVSLPIIFNDVTALTVNEPKISDLWYQSLLRKIAESTGNEKFDVTSLSMIEQTLIKSGNYSARPRDAAHVIAKNIWVLGASLGGPDMLKRFLTGLPADVPAAFIVAQHLGANFVQLLAAQLSRKCKLKVLPASEGHLLRHQEVVVAPVNERLGINTIGNLELEAVSQPGHYTPSIDRIITDIANRYRQRAGAIIFSGMGDDGAMGCRNLRALGGQVWVQSAETCVISSMPDTVRRSCDVQVVGSPEYLARRLTGYLMTHHGAAS
ncbi:MAG: chemotaxis protein CheB [Gammaproteobacteria bacterium]|nr:chemotaxis protein CheB [Gammaproteobacteria bacterium]